MRTVSVIIPCYNAGKYIAACLDSVLNQESLREIICIDDGSQDDTSTVIRQYEAKHPGLITLVNGNRMGAPKARNKGLEMATGDHIQFLDADDVLLPGKFEKQLKGFIVGIDWVVSDYEKRDEQLVNVLSTHKMDDIETNPLQCAIKKVILTINPLYRREAVMAIGGYREDLRSAQDWDFHLRLVLAGKKSRYVPGIFSIHRQVNNSISSNWIKVSIHACEVISGLQGQVRENDHFNRETASYLAMLYYHSAVFVKDDKRSQQYAGMMKKWAAGDYSFLHSSFKALLARVTGSDLLIKLHRKMNSTRVDV